MVSVTHEDSGGLSKRLVHPISSCSLKRSGQGRRISMRGTILISGVSIILAAILLASAQTGGQWKIHDRTRPAPPAITPGECSTQDHVGAPPSDATVLFDGKD